MSEDSKRCPYCDEEIHFNAIKYKHCGSSLMERPAVTALHEISVLDALGARYEVLHEIGRGGMGVVYKAIQRNLDRVVALKVLPQTVTPDAEVLKRFQSEARKAALLNHPHIVAIYDSDVKHGVPYLAMEFIDGRDLRTIIVREGPLPFAKVIVWIKPVVEALAFAHHKGLVHRDIKSANILVSNEGRPVLTDFGIAKIIEDSQVARADETSQLTQIVMAAGTLQFMSPELLAGKPAHAVSDIYALGVVMYHCLTGELPFRSDLEQLMQLDAAENTAPDRAKIFERWGDFWMKMRNYDEAAEKYRNGLAALPNDVNLVEKSKNAERQKDLWLDVEVVHVHGETFEMGDSFGDGENDERPLHKVTVKDFFIGKYEITFGQYEKFCRVTRRNVPSDNGWGAGKRPVINVSWNDANDFCRWLSRRTGKVVRLPTEAEWEFAARNRGQGMKWAGTNEAQDLRCSNRSAGESGQMHFPTGFRIVSLQD
ncbi:MAG: bifunctional serine/threonine-protein kinase/formylglycine-generating enzyme family protein [bacterium]